MQNNPTAFKLRHGIVIGHIPNYAPDFAYMFPPDHYNNQFNQAILNVYNTMAEYLEHNHYKCYSSKQIVDSFNVYLVIHHNEKEYRFIEHTNLPSIWNKDKPKVLKNNKTCLFHICYGEDRYLDEIANKSFTFLS